MTKILATLRAILKALGRHAKLSVSVALSVPGFLKIEVQYARDLGKPRQGMPDGIPPAPRGAGLSFWCGRSTDVLYGCYRQASASDHVWQGTMTTKRFEMPSKANLSWRGNRRP